VTGPLAGLRIGVTRSRSQAARLSVLLAAAGAEPVEMNLLEFHDPPSWGPFDEALEAWQVDSSAFDGLALTSVNAVERAVSRCRSGGADLAELAKSALVAVVGTATAEAARDHGLVPDVVPARASSEGLLEALTLQAQVPKRWLIPRALDTREVLETSLRGGGAQVHVAPVYRSAPPSDPSPVRQAFSAGMDVLTFCSGSAVTHLRAVLDESWPAPITSVAVASIGPITSQAARDAGLQVVVEAESARLESLVEAVVRWKQAR
jgi:uroporphyrinogen III methyltransferase / synthase